MRKRYFFDTSALVKSASEISKLDLFIATDETLGKVAIQKGLRVFAL